MAANSNGKARRRKTATDRPQKPYADFPMTAHAGGKWYKKIRGKLHYFGRTRLVEDLDATDFQSLRADIANSWGPVRLGNEVVRVKSVFKYAAENKLIPQPVVFGTEFRKPGKAVLRKHRAKQDKKLFESGEIRSLLDAASPSMKAAILLGINCGAGNSDCS